MLNMIALRGGYFSQKRQKLRKLASSGLYKTSHRFDGTVANPGGFANKHDDFF